MLTCTICRNGTGHKRGFVYRSPCLDLYLLMHFHTDFFFEVNGNAQRGKAGDWILHRPGTQVAHGPCSQRASFVNDWLFFSAQPEDKSWLTQLPYDVPIPIADGDTFAHCVSGILSEQIRKDPFSDQLISGHIYHLLSTLHRARQTDSQRANTLLLHFQQVRTHILTNCGQPWTLPKMATLAGYSVSRFCELYKRFFAKSPVDDLLDERLSLAKRLLALNSYSVGEVAALCGFSSLHYFSNYFKSRTGLAPTDY